MSEHGATVGAAVRVSMVVKNLLGLSLSTDPPA